MTVGEFIFTDPLLLALAGSLPERSFDTRHSYGEKWLPRWLISPNRGSFLPLIRVHTLKVWLWNSKYCIAEEIIRVSKDYKVIHALRYLQRLFAKKLLLKADAFDAILLWFSLSRDSQQSAPVKIKHLAAKSSCIWVSGLSVFRVLKGICTVVSLYTLIWSWTQSILLFFRSLFFSYTVQSSVLSSDCNKTYSFNKYFLIRHLHSFLV